jgi:small conductance mechanosensitive channel
VVIPNGGLSNGSLINYSAEATRRQEWTFGIGYGDDVDKAKAIIKNIIDADERVLKEPEGLIEINALADSSVNILVRAWVASENYWPLYYAVTTEVYKAFNAEGISIPFPQMDVHLQK